MTVEPDAGRAFIGSVNDGEWIEVGHVTQDGVSVRLRDDDGRRDRPLLVGPTEVTLVLTPQPDALAAFVDDAGIVIYGVLRICDLCWAPAVNPFPDGWRMGIHVGSSRLPELTPHRPDCVGPTPAALLPGRAVYDASPPDREERRHG